MDGQWVEEVKAVPVDRKPAATPYHQSPAEAGKTGETAETAETAEAPVVELCLYG